MVSISVVIVVIEIVVMMMMAPVPIIAAVSVVMMMMMHRKAVGAEIEAVLGDFDRFILVLRLKRAQGRHGIGHGVEQFGD